MLTDSAARALAALRDPSHLTWTVIPMFAFVVYVYASEIERRNWSLVFAGLAFWAMDWFNEIWNALVLHFTQRAPVWGAPGSSNYVILVGLNIEICFMFAVSGVVWAKMLPKDPAAKVLGVPNRLFFALVNSIFCVVVELLLNGAGLLTWDWPWWGRSMPIPIVLFGYGTFFVVSYWVFDLKSVKKQATVTGALLGFDALCLALFGGALGWI